MLYLYKCNLGSRSDSRNTQEHRYDMAQPVIYIYKSLLSISPFWKEEPEEPPLELSKWAAMMKMAVLSIDWIEIRNLLRVKPALIDPTELS